MTQRNDKYESQAKLLNELMDKRDIYDDEAEFLIAQLNMATSSAREITVSLRKMQLEKHMHDGAVPWDDEELTNSIRGEIAKMAAVSFLLATKFDVDIWEQYTEKCTEIAEATARISDD